MHIVRPDLLPHPNVLSLPTSLNRSPIQGLRLHMARAVATLLLLAALVLATAAPAASMVFVDEDLDLEVVAELDKIFRGGT